MPSAEEVEAKLKQIAHEEAEKAAPAAAQAASIDDKPRYVDGKVEDDYDIGKELGRYILLAVLRSFCIC